MPNDFDINANLLCLLLDLETETTDKAIIRQFLPKANDSLGLYQSALIQGEAGAFQVLEVYPDQLPGSITWQDTCLHLLDEKREDGCQFEQDGQNCVLLPMDSYGWFAAISDRPMDDLQKKRVASFMQFMGRFLNQIVEREKLQLIEKELNMAKKHAEKASKAKELFLARMNHEIRTPLNVIIGMIRELGKEEIQDHQQGYVNHAKTAAEHLLSLMDDIFDMRKIESGDMELQNTEFCLKSLIETTFGIIEASAKEKKLKFEKKVTSKLKKRYFGDPDRIRKVLINLLGNAVKFTEKGYVKFELEINESVHENHDLRFVIKDSGIGISATFHEQMFDKFTQEDELLNRKYEGAGLGITLAKEVIDLMGGYIYVVSKKGEGTIVTFELTLPIVDFESADITLNNKEPVDVVSLEGKPVLLVEDNEINRFIAKKSLERFGCRVTEAENGKEATELFLNNDYDLVLMDIQMPVMDGVKATQYIRNELQSDVPIIALTANAFKHEIDAYLEAGMNDYLTKPYDEQVLRKKMEKYILSKPVKENNKEEEQQNSGLQDVLDALDAEEVALEINQPVDDNEEESTPALYTLKPLKEISHGEPEFIRKMLKMFVEQTDKIIPEMRKASKEGEYERINKMAHRIKPSIDNVGIESLTDKIRELEAFHVTDDNRAEFNDLLNLVCLTLEAVSFEIEQNELT